MTFESTLQNPYLRVVVSSRAVVALVENGSSQVELDAIESLRPGLGIGATNPHDDGDHCLVAIAAGTDLGLAGGFGIGPQPRLIRVG